LTPSTIPFPFAESTADEVLQHFANLPAYDEAAVYIQSYTEHVSWMYSVVNLKKLNLDVKSMYSPAAGSKQLHPHRLAVYFMVTAGINNALILIMCLFIARYSLWAGSSIPSLLIKTGRRHSNKLSSFTRAVCLL
jgi:hypothetical protein